LLICFEFDGVVLDKAYLVKPVLCVTV